MKKALVLGDCNSIFVKHYIESVLLGKYEVVLLKEGNLSQAYSDFYLSKGVHVEPLWIAQNSWTKHLPFIRSSVGTRLWAREMLNKYGHIDIIHVHGISRSRCEIALALRRTANIIILTVWGSDLLRRTSKQLRNYKLYYDQADCITVASKHMKDSLLAAYGLYLSDKTYIIAFPLVVLDIIDCLKGKVSRTSICKDLGIEYRVDKINVFIGHNGRDCQRHFELTAAMAKLPSEIKGKINLIYTMTYGVPQQTYLDDLRSKAKESGCNYSFVEGYQTEENIAKLRLMCDILLHAQLTDAASASFFECMYAGAICVNGSWLPYEHIADYHNRVIEYEDIAQLTDVVQDIVTNYDSYKKRFAFNIGFRNGSPTSKETAEQWYHIIDSR